MRGPRGGRVRDRVGMAFDIAHPESLSDGAAWAVFESGRLLRGAAERIEQAGMQLIVLAEDTNWRSRGIAALHACLDANGEALAVIATRVQVEAGRLPF